MTELVIDVPLAKLPPSPNSARTLHWAEKARQTKVARQLAWAAGYGALSDFTGKRIGQAPRLILLQELDRKMSVKIVVIYPQARSGPMTDPDSALARLKPLIDGLVDAGCLRGDGPADVSYEPIQQRKEGKQLIVRFTLRSPG